MRRLRHDFTSYENSMICWIKDLKTGQSFSGEVNIHQGIYYGCREEAKERAYRKALKALEETLGQRYTSQISHNGWYEGDTQ